MAVFSEALALGLAVEALAGAFALVEELATSAMPAGAVGAGAGVLLDFVFPDGPSSTRWQRGAAFSSALQLSHTNL